RGGSLFQAAAGGFEGPLPQPQRPADGDARGRAADHGFSGPAALGSIPLEVWREEKFLALLPDEAAVRRAAPNLAKVAALPGDGLIVSARGEQQDFVSRYFAPAFGIDEDAVTGSAHCVLTPFWVERLQRNPLRARQVPQRGGDLLCLLGGARVVLSGRAVLYLEGSITI